MPRAVRTIRMLHIADLKAETIKDAALKSISTDADLVGDATSSHNLLSMFFHSYEGKVIPHEDIEKELPWVHKAIKRFRDQLNAIHIAIKRDYLQGYLDEFTWRFNHRKAGEEKFGMLMQLSAGYKNGFMHRRYAKSS